MLQVCIRSIYKPVSQILKMVAGVSDSDLKSKQVIMCRFGSDSGAEVLALLTPPKVYEFNEERRQLVYLPTSPLPISGALVFVPLDSVQLVPNMRVYELMKIYLSLGALTPDIARVRFGALNTSNAESTNSPECNRQAQVQAIRFDLDGTGSHPAFRA